MAKRITDLTPFGGSPGGGLHGTELVEIAIPGSPSLSRSILIGQIVDYALTVLGSSAPLDVDVDGTLAANSDSRIATQKAVKTYADALIGAANAIVYKNVIDCSANPNYPAADAGDLYIVSVAGKIGGASGVTVEVGDMALCHVDSSAGGNQATVGANWNVIQGNVVSGSLVTSVSGRSGAVVLDHSDITDFTESVQDVVGAFIAAAAGVHVVYDDAGNTLTFSSEEAINAQTGTTYTLVTGDLGKMVTLSNAAAIALTIPQGGSAGFPAKWWCDIEALGAGAVTGTPAGGSTIDGAATIVATTKQGFRLVTDGTNWFTIRGLSSGTFTGGTLSSPINEAALVTLAAAGTMNIGAALANTINVSGNSGPITTFDNIAAGAKRTLVFASTPTINHDATSLILPTGANIAVAAGDTAQFVSLGGGHWLCLWYQRKSGAALASSGGGGGGGGFTYSGTAPSSPSVGDRWVDSVNGILLTYIDDGTGSSWVEF